MKNHKQNNKSQIPKIKQISPAGVSGETITEISNSKRDIAELSPFWSLDIGILNLFEIWCLNIGI